MKFCLSSNQPREYLQKADEIKVKYQERKNILELGHAYPDKTIILDCFDEIDWESIKECAAWAHGNLVLCLKTAKELREAQSLNIKHYLGFPIESFFELNSLKLLDIEYAILGPSLFFRMPEVINSGVKVRCIPNIAYWDGLPHLEGVCGTWIRPEDLDSVYGEAVAAIEFIDCDLKKEQALYRVYAEEKRWSQELQLLITNLDYPGLNRAIEDNALKCRYNCGQRCQSGGACRKCYTVLRLADPGTITALNEKVDFLKNK